MPADEVGEKMTKHLDKLTEEYIQYTFGKDPLHLWQPDWRVLHSKKE